MSSEKYYDANTIATYVNFSECLLDSFEGLSEAKFNEIVLSALRDVGLDGLDQKKLEKSV